MQQNKRRGFLLALAFFLCLSVPVHASEPEKPAGVSSAAPSFQQSQVHKLTLAELRKKYADTFKFRGPQGKNIALTFDDVPDPRFTPRILEVLQAKHVHATFFIVGARAQKHPELVTAIKQGGHAIGNHSYNHPQFRKLSMAAFQKQIKKTERTIFGITGIKPRLIRPPYGEINEEQVRWAKRNGYKIVNWDVDSLDWKGIGKEQVKQNVLSQTGPGSIILQHAGGGTGSDLTGTIEALPQIIDELRSRGYHFVTVPELIHTTENKQAE